MANPYPNLSKAFARFGVLFTIGLIVLLLFGARMTTTIGAGEGGVKFSSLSGTEMTEKYGEGFHIHAPWTDIVRYDVKIQEQLEEVTALSSNGLSIGMDLSVRWRALQDELPALHTTYGPDYYRKLIQPEMRSGAREIVGRYTPEQLYASKRTELQTEIETRIRQAVDGQHVRIEAVLIRDVQLPDQIRLAIENKLKEEQEAERYEYTIAKERLEAERKEIEANGEAAYQRIITQTLSPQFLRFKGIEATLRLAESPNSKVVVVGGGGTDGLPLILGGQ